MRAAHPALDRAPGNTRVLRFAAAIALVVVGCAARPALAPTPDLSANVVQFEHDLQQLQTELAIPGIAYVVVQDGVPIATRAFGSLPDATKQAFAVDTPLRIASVTKAVTAVVALQQVDAGRLDLEAPARRYAPTLKLPDEVRVRHLLTHTSEGEIGGEFVYGTNRYAMLADVLTGASGRDFAQLIEDDVLTHAGMRRHASPDLGAHAALVSTTQDMGAFLVALDTGQLLPPRVLERLATPSRADDGSVLPVSLGWFAQTIQGRRVAWSFGQDDPEHSGALLIRVPDARLSLFVLASSNVLSDPFRLLMGDVSKSPVATSFLRAFVFSPAGAPLPSPAALDASPSALAEVEARTQYRYRDEFVGAALVDLWNGKAEAAQATLDRVAARHGAPEPDAVLHFAALRLPAERREAAIRAGERLLAAHPRNRWMLLVQGYLLQQDGRAAAAAACFERILALPNQQPDFLAGLFRAWSLMALAQLEREHDPTQARARLRHIVEERIGGEMQGQAEQLLRELDAAGSETPGSAVAE